MTGARAFLLSVTSHSLQITGPTLQVPSHRSRVTGPGYCTVLLLHARSSWDVNFCSRGRPSSKNQTTDLSSGFLPPHLSSLLHTLPFLCRPLSSRGRKAAKRIAERMAHEGWLPDLILCSDALRTKETLDHMCQAVGSFREIPVLFLGSFYSVAAMDGQTAIHLQVLVAALQHWITRYSIALDSTVLSSQQRRCIAPVRTVQYSVSTLTPAL